MGNSLDVRVFFGYLWPEGDDGAQPPWLKAGAEVTVLIR